MPRNSIFAIAATGFLGAGLSGAAIWTVQTKRVAGLNNQIAQLEKALGAEQTFRQEQAQELARLEQASTEAPEPEQAPPEEPVSKTVNAGRVEDVAATEEVVALKRDLETARARIAELETEMWKTQPHHREFTLTEDQSFALLEDQVAIGFVTAYPSEIQVRFEGELLRMATGSTLNKELETHLCTLELIGFDWETTVASASFELDCRLRE